MAQKLSTSKAFRFTAVLCALALPACAAYAIGGLGDIVYDPSNYAQAVKQVQAWEQQYAQMKQGLAKAEATFQQVKSQVDAITGVRGFGDVLNNPALRTLVPNDLARTLTRLNTTGELTGEAATIRTRTALYDCQDISDERARGLCRALLSQTAQAQAYQQDTMALLSARTGQIEALRGQIDRTQDEKAISELQARLEVETAQVANDQNKILIANAMLSSAQTAAVQAQQERINALMSPNKPSALNGFSFADLGYQRSAGTSDIDQ